jgi:hypothetical protein
LRSPSTRAGPSSPLPQFRQNLAPAGLVVLQWGQFISMPFNTQQLLLPADYSVGVSSYL